MEWREMLTVGSAGSLYSSSTTQRGGGVLVDLVSPTFTQIPLTLTPPRSGSCAKRPQALLLVTNNERDQSRLACAHPSNGKKTHRVVCAGMAASSDALCGVRGATHDQRASKSNNVQ